ncbi:MAG TPA: hypothetical protein PKD10_00900 [Paracoccaceae bacterium]|nr:hypothetical protein [Paracoccaceae bacterium]HMO71088.1 hypothetical protein [Paracoccaceae bacterium]
MLIHDRLVFLQLQKTACTHIAAELQQRLGGTLVGKHQPLGSSPDGRLIVGSVRNPWDWYVSLWAYGCSGQGMVHRILARGSPVSVLRRAVRNPRAWPAAVSLALRSSGEDRAFWQRVYRDPDDPGAFRAWLVRLLTTHAKADVFEDWRKLPLFEHVGLYSARYAQMFTLAGAWQRQAASISTVEGFRAYLEAELLVDRFILMERLEEDLAALLCELGQQCTADDLRGAKRNASRRRGYTFYHDAETEGLIAQQDRLVAERHGYSPREDLAAAQTGRSA